MARPKMKIDLEKLEELANLGLSQREIARYFSMSESHFYELKKSNPEFLEKIYSGRAKRIEKCSRIIINAMETQNDPKWAMEYLKRHGDLWKINAEQDGADTFSNLILE